MSTVGDRASPDRPNVLITSASRKVLLVRAFRDALAALGGGRVLAADSNRWAVALYEADAVVTLPATDAPTFVEVLERCCEEEQIGLVVPTRDAELPVLAAARDRLERGGTMILVSSPEAVATCRDKLRFSAAVEAAGLDSPRIHSIEEVPLPAFVKPRSGAGGRGATVVTTQAELVAACTAIAAAGGEPVAQEYIDATEFTIDVFIDRHGRAISCVPRERVAVIAGESVISRTVRDPDLSTATLRLCTALELTGHLTVQAFRTPERIVFVEVNPRYGGAANLGFAAGARTPEYAIRAARGEHLEPRLEDYEAGLMMLRYSEDRFVRASDAGGTRSAS